MAIDMTNRSLMGRTGRAFVFDGEDSSEVSVGQTAAKIMVFAACLDVLSDFQECYCSVCTLSLVRVHVLDFGDFALVSYIYIYIGGWG